VKHDTEAEEDVAKDFDIWVSAGGRVENLDNRDREIVKPKVLCGLNKGVDLPSVWL
jgi:hypothetical protein